MPFTTFQFVQGYLRKLGLDFSFQRELDRLLWLEKKEGVLENTRKAQPLVD